MKTQITKANALIIIENAVKQEKLLSSLEKLLDWDGGVFNGSLSIIEPLFNINFDELSNEDYDRIWKLYFDEVGKKGNDFPKMAENIYNSMLKMSLEMEKKEKAPSGVISLLKGRNYNISGEFNLET